MINTAVMKVLYTYLLFTILSLSSAFAQDKAIICIYESEKDVPNVINEIENEVAKQMLIKDFNEDKRVYSMYYSKGIYMFKKMPESIDKVQLETEPLEHYINFNDNTYIRQEEHWGKKYIKKGNLQKYEWDITGNTKEIGDKTCSEAILKGKKGVKAWFCTDVPITVAPLGYFGLPGLTIRLETPVYTLNLKEIKNTQPIKIEPPTEGKVTTEKEIEKISEKNKEKLFKSADKVTIIEK